MDWGVFAGRVSLLCVGNELSGDDGLGAAVARGLAGLPGAQVIYAHTAPENFIDEVIAYRPERVVIVDAADFGGRPGEIRLIDSKAVQAAHFSTHRAPMRLLLGRLEAAGIGVALVGVQAAGMGLGEPMCSEVEYAARAIIGGVKSYRMQTG